MAIVEKRLHRIEDYIGKIVQREKVSSGDGSPMVKPTTSGAPPKTLLANKKRDAEKAFGNGPDEWAKTRSAILDAERKHVFLAYREVFTGKNALVRKKKAIRNLVFRHHWPTYEKSVEISEINVVRILKSLLEDHVFESEEYASKEFPELFVKPFQDSHLVKQDDSKGIAIKERNMSLNRNNNSGYLTQYNPHGTPLHTFHKKCKLENLRVLVLQPLRLPFITQHSILSSTQQLLEESCFEFMKERFPSVLEKHGWTCAAEGELTKWLCILKGDFKDHPVCCIGVEEQASLKCISPTVAQLRHTVVHRRHITLEQVLDQLRCARILVEILQNNESVSTLQALHWKVDSYAQELEKHREAIQKEVDATFLSLQRQKETLIQGERQFHAYVAKQNIRIAAGQAFDHSISLLPATHKAGSIVEDEKNTMCVDYGVEIEEGDIESDEDQLQAEL